MQLAFSSELCGDSSSLAQRGTASAWGSVLDIRVITALGASAMTLLLYRKSLSIIAIVYNLTQRVGPVLLV